MFKKLTFGLILVTAFTALMSLEAVAQENKSETEDRQGKVQERRQRMGRGRRGNRRGGPGGQRGRRGSTQNSLTAAELAPEFKLSSLDGKTETQLADLRKEKPVVLFFGSYT